VTHLSTRIIAGALKKTNPTGPRPHKLGGLQRTHPDHRQSSKTRSDRFVAPCPASAASTSGSLYMTRSEIRFNAVDQPARPRLPSAATINRPPPAGRVHPAADLVVHVPVRVTGPGGAMPDRRDLHRVDVHPTGRRRRPGPG